MDPAHTNPNLGQWELHQRLKDAQQELDRALAFPRLVTYNDETNNLLELLRVADNLAADPGKTRSYATRAESLLSTQPPPERLPPWLIRAITLVARQRAKL